jgi:hypothetical protein
MNMLFRYAVRLTAVGALAVVISAPASASDVELPKSLKLAMGPMSAAQKNQSPEAVEKSDAVEIKPPHHVKRHDRIKHRRRHHLA